MIEIDGLVWFVGALVICGANVLYLRSWRREQRAHAAWWRRYAVDAEQRHTEFMRVMDDGEAGGADQHDWHRNDRGERGQA